MLKFLFSLPFNLYFLSLGVQLRRRDDYKTTQIQQFNT